MDILAVLSLKGGVGKTTSAMHLACCAQQAGRTVTLLDADEEQSACRWASFLTLPFAVMPVERDRMAQQVRALVQAGGFVVLDTPPNNREILSRAAMLASRVLVPVVPTGLDVDRLTPTLELLRDIEATRGELDAALLLTRWDGRKLIAREALEALKGYPVLENKIHQRVRYEEAFGTLPSYLEEYQAVWEELQ